MMSRRVRFLRSSSSRLDGGGNPAGGDRHGPARRGGHHGGGPGGAGADGHDRRQTRITRLDGTALGETEEVRPQLLGRGVARGRILGHRLHDHGLERGRDGRVGDAREHGLVAHVLGRDRHGGVAGEGRPPDRHLVEDDAERVDVAAGVDALAFGLLGREVRGRAHDGAGLGEALLGVDGPGDAEVGDLDLAVGGDQHVARLHVAVHDAVAVGEGKGRRDAGADLGDLVGRQLLRVAQDGRERASVDVLHHDEVDAVVLAPVEDGDDVGVGQVGGGLGLPAEPLHKGLVDGELGKEDLEGDRPIELAVYRPIDLGHPTAGDQVGQLVATRIGARSLDGLHAEPSLRWAHLGAG